MPARLEDCTTLELPCPRKVHIQGHSKAGERTGFWVAEWKLVVDFGLSTYRSPKAGLVTHSHTDHTWCVPITFTSRGKARNLYMPQACLVPLTMTERSIISLSDGKICTLEPEEVWAEQKLNPVIISAGDVFSIPELDDLCVEVLPCYHTTESVGYGFSTVTSKLKSEYKELTGKEIGKLRRDGVEITERRVRPEFVIFGDTDIRALTDHDEWKKYPVILIECTGYGKYRKAEDLIHMGHIHYDHLKPVIESCENHFVLIHTSMAITANDIPRITKEINNSRVQFL
ncbi:MAG: hypothetical protein QF535_04695 [Anaerolineales bacterium]|nr:hypothetical protein [Anaerolineales bacterium]